MLRVVIESEDVKEKRGVSPRTQKEYRIREQGAYIYLLGREGKENRFPSPVRLNLEDDQAPYKVGEYTLSLSSLYVGRFDALQVGRVDLVPKVQSVARTA